MMLKMALFATAALVGVSVTAWAGEANGDPFPGPDAAVTTSVQTPNYTMGSDAPFNYFAQPSPTSMAGYTAAAAAPDDPYPFEAPGEVIRVQPAPRTSVVNGVAPGTHG